jgi:predicted ester cyclase
MSELNKELMRRFADEVVNAHDLDAADEFVDQNFVEHEAGLESGLSGFKRSFGMFFSAFPDLTMTIDDLVAEHDKVVARVTYRGTNSGEFMGIAPTNNRVKVSGIDILRFDNEKMIEHWGLTDIQSMFQQLGLAPGAPKEGEGGNEAL